MCRSRSPSGCGPLTCGRRRKSPSRHILPSGTLSLSTWAALLTHRPFTTFHAFFFYERDDGDDPQRCRPISPPPEFVDWMPLCPLSICSPVVRPNDWAITIGRMYYSAIGRRTNIDSTDDTECQVRCLLVRNITPHPLISPPDPNPNPPALHGKHGTQGGEGREERSGKFDSVLDLSFFPNLKEHKRTKETQHSVACRYAQALFGKALRRRPASAAYPHSRRPCKPEGAADPKINKIKIIKITQNNFQDFISLQKCNIA